MNDNDVLVVLIEKKRDHIKVSVGKKSTTWKLPKGKNPKQFFLEQTQMAAIYSCTDDSLQEFMNMTTPSYKNNKEAARDFAQYKAQYTKLKKRLGLDDEQIDSLSRRKQR